MVNPISDIAKITTKPAASSAGLPCPKCGTRIELTLDSLLVRRNFTCANPQCRTILTLDERASAEALKIAKIIKAETGPQNPRSRPFRSS